MTAPEYLLEAIDIVKVFGTLRANDGVTLRVAPGQIHALLGENGAGKSTLVKMLYGSLQPTSGTIKWMGQDVIARGWYRRSPGPMIELRDVEADGKRARTWEWVARYAGSCLVFAAGLVVLFASLAA